MQGRGRASTDWGQAAGVKLAAVVKAAMMLAGWQYFRPAGTDDSHQLSDGSVYSSVYSSEWILFFFVLSLFCFFFLFLGVWSCCQLLAEVRALADSEWAALGVLVPPRVL